DLVSNLAALVNVYEPLVTADADMRIQPCLAESWQSPDPLTWTFRLRRSVTFHSGRALRAADVVYSFDRLRRDPKLEMRGHVREVRQVVAVDDHTVMIQTGEPARMILNKLKFVMIVPEGATDEALKTAPDGTGPYALRAWRPEEPMHLVRNEKYWGRAP